MAPHSSTLAWKIPWTEEPGRLQSMGSLRVGHYWATSLSLFTFLHWRRKWQPTPVFLPGESQDRGAWWAVISGVAQSQTRLKQLSSACVWHMIGMHICDHPCVCTHAWHVRTHVRWYSLHVCACVHCFSVCMLVYVCRNVCALCSQEQCEFRHLLWQLALPCWILQCFDTVWNRSFTAWGLLIA